MNHRQRSRYVTLSVGPLFACIAVGAVAATASSFWLTSHGASSAVMAIAAAAISASLLGGGARHLAPTRLPLRVTGRLTRSDNLGKTHDAWRIALHEFSTAQGGVIPQATAASRLGRRREGGNPNPAVSRPLPVTHWNSLLGVHRRSPLPHQALQFTRNRPRTEAHTREQSAPCGPRFHQWSAPGWDISRHRECTTYA